MKNKIITTIMMCLVMISLVSAAQVSIGTFKQGSEITILQGCGTCTYNNITSIVFPNSTHLIIDEGMTRRDTEYTYIFNQTDGLGSYLINGAGDLDGTANAWAYDLTITLNGRTLDLPFTIMYITLILFLMVLGFIYHHLSGSTDLERWNNRIYQEYKDRNYVKVALNAIGYHFMKSKFIIYYLIGLPIIVVITEVSATYNMVGFYTILQNLLIVYLVGVVVVGIVFLSYIQEWFMDLLNMVRDNDWGIER